MILTSADNTSYTNLPTYYFGQNGQRIFPDVAAGEYKVVVLGQTNYAGFNFAVNDIISPPKVILFLHGFQGDPSSWDKFTSKIEKKKSLAITSPIIFGGTKEDVATAIPGLCQSANNNPINCNFYFYRIEFGAYDTVSGRVNVLGKPAKSAMSGDFETFETLGLEVKQAITCILEFQPNAEIILMAHSRGGLAARAFLQGPDSAEKSAVIGLVTLGTPHHGSYFGRLGPYLEKYSSDIDPETWRIVKILRHSDQVDAYRPTVGDLATGGDPMNSLNASVGNLPTTNIRYLNYVYIGRAFGDFPFAIGNIFHGSDSLVGHVSNAAKKFMLGTTPYGQLAGDGVVDQNSERMDTLTGLPANIDITIMYDANGVFHTDEHDQSRDILNALETVRGWQILP